MGRKGGVGWGGGGGGGVQNGLPLQKEVIFRISPVIPDKVLNKTGY